MPSLYDTIDAPTLLLNEQRVRHNIKRMVERARNNQIRFRPHFKTHQSAAVGEWFRQAGVNAITVSSLEMARYFAIHGWDDITVAFPVNIREIDKINQLARQVKLHLLVENLVTAEFLDARLAAPVRVWLEIDAGYQRSGVGWNDSSGLVTLTERIAASDRMVLQGLLTHDGGTYAARTHGEIEAAYTLTTKRLNHTRNWLMEHSFLGLEISIGDTPACSVLDDLGTVDEMRPGNFVFYDWMQVEIGSCTVDDVATVVACPIVSTHPERNDLIIYGGAVHLSKESLRERSGRTTFGAVVLLQENGWSAPLPNVWVRSISQEHGIIHAEGSAYAALVQHVQVGDLIGVVPIHSCLTADLLKHYRTLDNDVLSMAPISPISR